MFLSHKYINLKCCSHLLFLNLNSQEYDYIYIYLCIYIYIYTNAHTANFFSHIIV